MNDKEHVLGSTAQPPPPLKRRYCHNKIPSPPFFIKNEREKNKKQFKLTPLKSYCNKYFQLS